MNSRQRFLTRIAKIALGAATALAAAGACAQAKWDMTLPWGPTEFHVLNARKFAQQVGDSTQGRVRITVHPAGVLGIKVNESLRAVEDGTVPMASYTGFQNVGDVPLLAAEALPFLVGSYEELRIMHDIARPLWEAELLKRNQKLLYIVPWPNQNFFTKKAVGSPADLKGVRIRTNDPITTELATSLGMLPQQMNGSDVVPALASGRLDAVMTSGTTAVSQKYWEFLSHAYNTNHVWVSELVVVNLDAWQRLSPDLRAAVEKTAREVEPGFWEVSRNEHQARMADLQRNGMAVDLAPRALVERMRTLTRPMWDTFAKRNGAEGERLIAEFRKRVGK